MLTKVRVDFFCLLTFLCMCEEIESRVTVAVKEKKKLSVFKLRSL